MPTGQPAILPPAWHRLLAGAAARPSLVLAAFTVMLTAALLAALPRPLSPDVSGQLWIADRLRHGARLYVDISEVNPPLWFWLAVPVQGLSGLLDASGASVLIFAIGCTVLASLFATNRLLSRFSPVTCTALLLYGAFVLLLMPLRDLGQREQLVLVGALPYAALIAARHEERRVPAWLALLVGGGAAIGFALKNYFIGVPLLLELWLAFGLRRGWRPFRSETVVLALGALGYGATILLATPDYLRISVPELALAYGATGAPDLRYMLRPAQPIWALILCGIGGQRIATRRSWSPVTTALLIAALGFFAGWLIQHKGWPYQSIPTTGTLAMALATQFAEGALHATSRPRPITIAALVAPALLCVVPTQWIPTADTDIAPALADLKLGDTVAIVTKEGRTAWPSTVDRGLRFSGRRASFWILSAIDADARGDRDPRIEALGRRVVREAVNDYRCLPPRRLIFAPGRASGAATASDDPLDYFLRSPAFARLLRHYRRLDRPGRFDAFELVRPLGPVPAAAQCPIGL